MPPFRWDLVTPDQLGSLLDDVAEPSLWFRDDLVTCAGKVLARGGDARLVFVGRSLDSMFDLLSGALPDRVTRLPLSFAGFTQAHVPRAREVLTEHGITPATLAREAVTFVDVVFRGSTFGELFSLLDNWTVDSRAPWDVIRRQLRFVGVTVQGKTSPNTWRWHQHAEWTARLPARAVQNVSLLYLVWTYFGDHQTKLTRSFRPEAWYADDDGPDRGDRTRQALAEAVALVRYGRGREGRRALARATDGEPARRESWLRSLVTELGR
ncbi:hypothetical protein [Actinophytocola sp. KF-1]